MNAQDILIFFALTVIVGILGVYAGLTVWLTGTHSIWFALLFAPLMAAGIVMLAKL